MPLGRGLACNLSISPCCIDVFGYVVLYEVFVAFLTGIFLRPLGAWLFSKKLRENWTTAEEDAAAKNAASDS